MAAPRLYYRGCCPVPVSKGKRSKGTWGGSRNRADRVSFHLTEKQCRDMIFAMLLAEHLGMPFNRFITIGWHDGGVADRDVVKATGQFITMVRVWLKSQGAKCVWAWVQEHGRVKGAHVHILLHVPPDLAPLFSRLPMRWVKRLLPGGYVKGVMDTKRSPEPGKAYWGHWGDPEGWRRRRVQYVLKCAPQALKAKLGATDWGPDIWGQSGRVYGKRMGIWQHGQKYLPAD